MAGSFKAVGSDTPNTLMTHWSQGFRNHYPSVKISIEGKGSSTAPRSLCEYCWLPARTCAASKANIPTSKIKRRLAGNRTEFCLRKTSLS